MLCVLSNRPSVTSSARNILAHGATQLRPCASDPRHHARPPAQIWSAAQSQVTSFVLSVEQEYGAPQAGLEHKTKCDFVSWDRPLAKRCPQCDAAFMVRKVSRAGVRLRCLADGCGWTAEPDAEAETPAAPDAKAS